MIIKFFTPHWGYEHRDFGAFCKEVSETGFDGIELNLAEDRVWAEKQLDTLAAHGLEYIAQHSGTRLHDFAAHCDHYRASLERIAAFKPPFINSHTGMDFFSFEQNLVLIDMAADVSLSTGVPICHETHRGRFPYHAALTCPYLQARPELRLTADFSHWCCVSESLLQGQEPFVEAAIGRADHIHSRVGHEQGPQINDPRAPELGDTVGRFLGWWDRIVDLHRAKRSGRLTITCEFGPWPYTMQLPLTRQPVASQWDVNLHMLRLLRERYR